MILVVTADWFREWALTENLHGVDIQVCRDAYGAMDFIDDAEVVFLDLGLPAANGVAILNELASGASRTPIILLADDLPEVDLAVHNIVQVLGVRDLAPQKVRAALREAENWKKVKTEMA